MKLIPLLILAAFFILRNGFTIIKGKRDKKKVTSFIFWGRKLIEVVVYFLIPGLLLFEIISLRIYTPFYYLGVALSLFGLILMVWTRMRRNKDWGFMGDTTGNDLFTDGPYKITRHPYYIGAILIGLGIYLQLNYFLLILMVPVIIFIMHVIQKEENFLEKEFGSRYLEYRSKVGIFPWFY